MSAHASALPEPVAPLTEQVLILEAGRADKHYWTDLWRYRELFFTLAWRDVSVRYKQTVIGLLWAVIRPFLTGVVFTVIFGRLAGCRATATRNIAERPESIECGSNMLSGCAPVGCLETNVAGKVAQFCISIRECGSLLKCVMRLWQAAQPTWCDKGVCDTAVASAEHGGKGIVPRRIY